MAQVINLPAFMPALLAAIEQRVPGASTDVERIPGLDVNYFRVAVLSEHFREMAFDDRHKMVWEIVREVLPTRDADRVISILPLTPEELETEGLEGDE